MESQTLERPPLEVAALRGVGGRKAVAFILTFSVAVVAFLFWLVYFKPRSEYDPTIIGNLPALNATLNALASGFLVAGYVAVRRGQYRRHMTFMFAALGSSALFFVSYVVYHHFHGDTKFAGTGFVRPVYFAILISHILLSAVAVPLILLSFYLSLSGRLAAHRKVSRFTFPIWLYVSVTGVLVFLLLKAFA
jgi:putative membrane protein